jgi:putative transposase
MGRIVRRIHQAGVYFVTTHTWQRRELFQQIAPAEIVVQQLLSCRDRGFYKLYEFVLMREHLHVLLTPGEETTLEKALQMIKGGSAHTIGKQLNYRWPIWQPGFHDRWIRDEVEYRNAREYMRRNPVKARLIEKAEEYQWSSASGQFVLDVSPFHVLQGLKPQMAEPGNVAPEGATHKAKLQGTHPKSAA